MGELKIIPNHVFGILILKSMPPFTLVEKSTRTISSSIGAYKSLVAIGFLRTYNSNNKTMEKCGNAIFYEHIIQEEKSY